MNSTAGFQEDLEKGKSTHLFPAFFAKERVKKGEIKEEDIPVSHLFYKAGHWHILKHISHTIMTLFLPVRGSWDNSDVKGAKNKKEWTETDKKNKSIPDWLRRGPNLWRGGFAP